jgi:hypothetical protein
MTVTISLSASPLTTISIVSSRRLAIKAYPINDLSFCFAVDLVLERVQRPTKIEKEEVGA